MRCEDGGVGGGAASCPGSLLLRESGGSENGAGAIDPGYLGLGESGVRGSEDGGGAGTIQLARKKELDCNWSGAESVHGLYPSTRCFFLDSDSISIHHPLGLRCTWGAGFRLQGGHGKVRYQ